MKWTNDDGECGDLQLNQEVDLPVDGEIWLELADGTCLHISTSEWCRVEMLEKMP